MSPSMRVPAKGLSGLIPRPRWTRFDEAASPLAPAAIESSTDRRSRAWRDLAPDIAAALAGTGHAALPAEGYALRYRDGQALVAAADAAGAQHAEATLEQLVRLCGDVPHGTIVDWPTLPRRGVIEGFYGPPWTHAERVHLMRLSRRLKLNSYVYAPKDDPYHRFQWRQLYGDAELAQLAELVSAAASNGVDFVYALHPATSMRFSDETEHALLHAKAAQLLSIGIRTIALLFDDVPPELADPADVARFGAGPGGTGAAHGHTCARFQDEVLRPRGILDPVVMVATDYAGLAHSDYRTRLAETLPADALIWWTGSDVVVGEISRADIDAAADAFGRRLLLWDNFPVNDFDRSRAFLGPLLGRTTDLRGSALAGVSANPMIEYRPSTFAIATVADWAWNTADYEPWASSAAAVSEIAGPDADALAPLVATLSSWPPSAPQDAELSRLVTAALSGDFSEAEALEALLDGLIALDSVGTGHDPELVAALRPWTDAAVASARAARAGLEAVRHPAEADATAVRRLLDAAETHFASVARDSIPSFVRAVLDRIDPAPPENPDGALVRVVLGAEPQPGEERLVEHLRARGLRMATGPDAAARLVIVPHGADPDAAVAATAGGAPVLAWGALAALGLAEDASPITQDRLDIVAPEHPLAAGLDGRVVVYRGRLTFTSVVPSARPHTVVARAVFEERPVIVSYPATADAGDGGEAVVRGEAVAFFLGRQDLAPWLVSPEGRRLFDAAVDHLLASPSAAPKAD